MNDDTIAVLDYPSTLYVYRFAYHSTRRFIPFGGLAFFALIFAYLAFTLPGSPVFHALFCAGAAVSGVVAAIFGYRILNHTQAVYQITTAGIEVCGKATEAALLST